MDCTQQKNAADCPCTYTACSKRGACCQCIAYHRGRDEMVACYFRPDVERTYDRSMTAFLGQFK